MFFWSNKKTGRHTNDGPLYGSHEACLGLFLFSRRVIKVFYLFVISKFKILSMQFQFTYT